MYFTRFVDMFTIENFAGALFIQAFYPIKMGDFFIPQGLPSRAR